MAPKSSRKSKSAEWKGESLDPGCSIEGIHAAWDADAELRARLRGGGPVMHEKSGLLCDNYVCTLNKALLLPLLSTMAECERKLPAVGDLRSEMVALYATNKRVGADVQASIAGDSIHIRKLLSFIKAKCRREEVSIEPCFRPARYWPLFLYFFAQFFLKLWKRVQS